jgi:hypothetical protein
MALANMMEGAEVFPLVDMEGAFAGGAKWQQPLAIIFGYA